MTALEEALRARWDRETLLVYADALQAVGDPRGELITLDVQIAERGLTPALALQRRRRLYAWLGGVTIAGRPIRDSAFRDGFVRELAIHHSLAQTLEAWLASPAGPFIRGMRVEPYEAAAISTLFEILAREPRPWLERLALHGGLDGVPDARWIEGAITMTPRLRTLGLFALTELPRVSHPRVEHFATDASQLGQLANLPAVTTLELALATDDDAADPALTSAIACARIRHLDLGGSCASSGDVYALARALPLDRLATLRLPPLRTDEERLALAEILESAPALEVTIARTYPADAAVVAAVAPHARLHLPEPRAWPESSTVSHRQAVSISVPTEEHAYDVSIVQLVDHLETQFDDMPANARAAWIAFWQFWDALPWEDAAGRPVTRAFPAATLETALDSLDGYYVDLDGSTPSTWMRLAAAIRAAELPRDAKLGIQRYWGVTE